MVDIGGLIDRLAPLFEKTVKAEYGLLVNSKAEAKSLSSSLEEIQDLLEEAERRRLTDPRLKNWLGQLQDVTYEIDDALDQWNTESIRLLLDNEDADASRTWLHTIGVVIHSFCSSFQHFRRRRNISLAIKELNEKVDLIGKETTKYAVLPIDNIETVQEAGRVISTSYSKVVKLKGQERQKDELVGKLLSPCQEPDIQVTTLFGMVGIGKTTLAQLAFHHSDVQQSFDLKLWIYIPYSPYTCDDVWIAKAILQSLHIDYHEDAALQTLLDLIKLSISGKKFLLVLDNVWREDDSMWRQLEACLNYGAPGSRILVTTRNEIVADLMGGMTRVKPLSDLDCWYIFKEVAFCGQENDMAELRLIGWNLGQRCGGLPLVARTLGSYLRSKHSKKLWEDVYLKELWQIEDVAKALFSHLAYCYNELPLAVKQCFLCCAVLREGEWILIDQLIRIWMVQGYFSSISTYAEMVSKGHEYFAKLASQSFFQEHDSNQSENFNLYKLHYLLYNFAQYLMNSGREAEKLRYYSNDGVSPDQLARLRSVRILLLKWFERKPPPSEIGDLIHLRYLGFRSSPVKYLPDTICNLYNLQTLDLVSCNLVELPEGIGRLRNLRHLLLFGTSYTLEKMPAGLRKLTALRTLDEFVVGRGVVNKLEYLKNLNQLGGVMYIIFRELNDEADVEDAGKAELKSKTEIRELELDFDGEVRLDVMEALQGPPNLQTLAITRYRGSQFPSWISSSANRVKWLIFMDCCNCSHLPPLGDLRFLEKLHFVGMKSLKRIGAEFLRSVEGRSEHAFPKLRELLFKNCEALEEWEDVNLEELRFESIFRRLKTLKLSGCCRLKSVPRKILWKAASVKQLHIEGCPLLSIEHIIKSYDDDDADDDDFNEDIFP